MTRFQSEVRRRTGHGVAADACFGLDDSRGTGMVPDRDNRHECRLCAGLGELPGDMERNSNRRQPCDGLTL